MTEIFKNINLNELKVILAYTGSLITFFTMLVAGKYIRKHKNIYYCINILFIFSFLTTIFAKEWLTFFVAWEMVTIFTALMLLWKNKELSSQYFIIQFFGSSVLLVITLVAMVNGYSEISPINEYWLQNLFILGLAMKSAIIGFHFWLPAVHSLAPVPVSAILSGWVVKLGFIILLKLIPAGNHLLLFSGFLMVFWGGFKALMATDFKVLLAYSTISHLGYIAIGIGSGTIYGYIGSILHIIVHGFAKTGLFLASGNFIKEYGSKCIYEFKNAWYRQKMTVFTIIVSFGSLMGVPFLAGFSSKYLIKYGLSKGGDIFTYILYGASLLTLLYSLRFLYWSIFRDLLKTTVNQIENKVSRHKLNKIEYPVLLLIIIFLLMQRINAKIIIENLGLENFNFNMIKGIIEFSILTLIAIIFLKKIKWLKREQDSHPSLDLLFNNINKGLYKSARFSYNLIYQNFQFQLLWIPLFLVILFLWQFLI